MKNIYSLEKSELLQRTRKLVIQERMTTMELIEHLREIDRRLLFLEMGHSSLFEFCLSHTLTDLSTSALLKHLVNEELKRQRKKSGLEPVNENLTLANQSDDEGRLQNSKIREGEDQLSLVTVQTNSNTTAVPVQTKTVRSRKHIPSQIRRKIWKRAECCCEATDLTGRCKSRYRLELDHIIPYAKGGLDTEENLRLFCRAHNLSHAVQSYGMEKMRNFRKR